MDKSLKLEINKSKYFGVCECGSKKEIIPFKDYSLDYETKKSFLINPFLCDDCGKKYPENTCLTVSKERKQQLKKQNRIIYVSTISLACAIILAVVINFVQYRDTSDPTFYNTGNPEDMTNKEYQDFLEWKEKQDQKEWENQKVFE